ncbi:MAG: hypothetical protein ABG776_04085 [Cyanobacteria bacterium J06555_13]
MPNPENILTAVRELEPQLPALLGEKATEVQQQISPLIDQLAAGQSDGADVLQVLSAHPALADVLQQSLGLQQPIEESSFDDLLRDRSAFQNLPGTPSSAIAGQRYICPELNCSEDWFQRRVGQSPPLCEVHGVVMVKDEG